MVKGRDDRQQDRIRMYVCCRNLVISHRVDVKYSGNFTDLGPRHHDNEWNRVNIYFAPGQCKKFGVLHRPRTLLDTTTTSGTVSTYILHRVDVKYSGNFTDLRPRHHDNEWNRVNIYFAPVDVKNLGNFTDLGPRHHDDTEKQGECCGPRTFTT